MAATQEIEISKLKIHPNNVRKFYRGIEELTESIRVKGILQNLTVVPDPDEDGTYFVVVGNRRLTAARLAGIETAPCTVVEMDEKEQAETMLLENMLRDDLTIYEQAQGFQMVLDLGETVDGLAEKTGFSKTTVRRRLNIAKLDQDILQGKEADGAFQLSLTDLYELEKIKDVDKRNDILKNARDSRNIAAQVRSTVAEEKRKKNSKKIIGMMKKAGLEEAPKKAQEEIYSNKWETLKSYDVNEDPPESIEVPEAEGAKLYYLEYWREIRIIKKAKKEKKEPTIADKQKAERDSRIKKVNASIAEMAAKRRDFIIDLVNGMVDPLTDEQNKIAGKKLWKVIREERTYITNDSFIEFLSGKEDVYKIQGEEKQAYLDKIEEMDVTEQELITAHHALKCCSTIDWKANFDEGPAKRLKELYDVLLLYGFTLDSSEMKLLDGTHDLYTAREIEEDEE